MAALTWFDPMDLMEMLWMFEWFTNPLGPCRRGSTTSWLGGDTGGQLCAVTALREVEMNVSERVQGNWMASTIFMVAPRISC